MHEIVHKIIKFTGVLACSRCGNCSNRKAWNLTSYDPKISEKRPGKCTARKYTIHMNYPSHQRCSRQLLELAVFNMFLHIQNALWANNGLSVVRLELQRFLRVHRPPCLHSIFCVIEQVVGTFLLGVVVLHVYLISTVMVTARVKITTRANWGKAR